MMASTFSWGSSSPSTPFDFSLHKISRTYTKWHHNPGVVNIVFVNHIDIDMVNNISGFFESEPFLKSQPKSEQITFKTNYSCCG